MSPVLSVVFFILNVMVLVTSFCLLGLVFFKAFNNKSESVLKAFWHMVLLPILASLVFLALFTYLLTLS